ncbi:hypothetical protein EO95_03860 [Methanosarcina sp. 1.H.T.1A.1]|nr:hypothetical protein EO95_03860 [Methanosarcina sp. 1.H.T.1A.1]
MWIASKQFITFVLSYFTRIGMQFTASANARKKYEFKDPALHPNFISKYNGLILTFIYYQEIMQSGRRVLLNS